jgi:hypothetical protein
VTDGALSFLSIADGSLQIDFPGVLGYVASEEPEPLMTLSSIKSAKPKTAARSRRAGPLTPEEKLLRAMFGQDVEGAALTPLASERAKRALVSKTASAGANAQTVEESETLELIGGLLDQLTKEIAHLNKELSSSMRRLVGKHKDGVSR